MFKRIITYIQRNPDKLMTGIIASIAGYVILFIFIYIISDGKD